MDFFIKKEVFSNLSDAASSSPRLRKNHNFHSADEHPCQRLLNALQPGTYIRPHCHTIPNKDETLIVVQGRLGIVIFTKDGQIADHAIAEVGGSVLGYHLPVGIFHTVVALAPDTIFFEAKAGPYLPLQSHELAGWAPAENTAAAVAYLQNLDTLFATSAQ